MCSVFITFSSYTHAISPAPRKHKTSKVLLAAYEWEALSIGEWKHLQNRMERSTSKWEKTTDGVYREWVCLKCVRTLNRCVCMVWYGMVY